MKIIFKLHKPDRRTLSMSSMRVSQNFWKFIRGSSCTYCATRFYSTGKVVESVLKYVFISKSENIFENLALEDWLYENYDLSRREILLLWRNTPAVVIGRHQNPWLESNVESVTSKCIPIVRRNSGGGAVYHDLGNLNLSFLTGRKRYNRALNLELIVKSLKEEWGIESKINSRSDIVIKNKKISGTASKLSRKNAYHHCTLLVDVNKSILSTSLCSPLKSAVIDNKATASKPTSTVNLRELDSSVNVDRLMTVIGLNYLSTTNSDVTSESRGFHFVEPNNKYFSGLDKKISTFKSWEWIYARTPKFTFIHNLDVDSKKSHTVQFLIKIEAAVIKDITLKYPSNFKLPKNSSQQFNALFSGKTYSETIVNQLEQIYYNKYSDEISKFELQ